MTPLVWFWSYLGIIGSVLCQALWSLQLSMLISAKYIVQVIYWKYITWTMYVYVINYIFYVWLLSFFVTCNYVDDVYSVLDEWWHEETINGNTSVDSVKYYYPMESQRFIKNTLLFLFRKMKFHFLFMNVASNVKLTDCFHHISSILLFFLFLLRRYFTILWHSMCLF